MRTESNSDSPRWSENAKQTLDGIIETVFLALLATTVGTILAVPLSFFAAKNLMRDVRIPAIQMGLAIAAIPLGVATGLLTFNSLNSVVAAMPDQAWVHGLATVTLVWISLRVIRLSVATPDEPRSRARRVVNSGCSGSRLVTGWPDIRAVRRNLRDVVCEYL